MLKLSLNYSDPVILYSVGIKYHLTRLKLLPPTRSYRSRAEVFIALDSSIVVFSWQRAKVFISWDSGIVVVSRSRAEVFISLHSSIVVLRLFRAAQFISFWLVYNGLYNLRIKPIESLRIYLKRIIFRIVIRLLYSWVYNLRI